MKKIGKEMILLN